MDKAEFKVAPSCLEHLKLHHIDVCRYPRYPLFLLVFMQKNHSVYYHGIIHWHEVSSFQHEIKVYCTLNPRSTKGTLLLLFKNPHALRYKEETTPPSGIHIVNVSWAPSMCQAWSSLFSLFTSPSPYENPLTEMLSTHPQRGRSTAGWVRAWFLESVHLVWIPILSLTLSKAISLSWGPNLPVGITVGAD